MRKNAAFFLVLVVLAAAIGWSTGCRKDAWVPHPPSLIGHYSGIYSYLEIEGVDTNVDTFQYVTFTFYASTYIMKLDASLQTEETRFFCDVEGSYRLEDGVTLEETDPNLTNKVCTYDHNPFDFFGLNQNTGLPEDTIIIKRDAYTEQGLHIVKELRLKLDS